MEFAATDCRARVNGLAEELETVGRGLLTEVQEDCQQETVELAERTTREEERKFRRLGEQEEARLTAFYEAEGKDVEKMFFGNIKQEERLLK